MPRIGGPRLIRRLFEERFGASRKLYDRASTVFPSGVTHDARLMRPFPIYIARADGSKKWDTDGDVFIDYWVGHGALILGHQRAEVVEAIKRQVERGTHYGACHETEVEWGEWVTRLVPSAELVRFTASGTEASLMALRLVRAYTGKRKIVKFAGHFHGWHDNLAIGINPPLDSPDSPGIPQEVAESCIVAPPNDSAFLDRLLAKDDGIAGIIIEPSGASYGTIPTREGFLEELRSLTAHHNVPLIFDEVITGFRYAPGGAQELYGVTPDLTILAKILAGGLPGGAVAGHRELLELLAFGDDASGRPREKVYHPGTFNANPLSASAGVATLRIVSTGEDIAVANARAKALRDGMNLVIEDKQVNWCVYGDASVFHILMNHDCPRPPSCDFEHCQYDYTKLKQADPELVSAFRCAMLLNGADLPGPKGMLSSAHTEGDVARTVEAFNEAISLLKADDLA